MRPFETIAELGIYLRLLIDIRDTLDKFQPAVFDRSLSELIAATAPRRDAPTMPAANRRRLKKLAKEYLRPGVHVERPARGAHAHPAAARAVAALRAPRASRRRCRSASPTCRSRYQQVEQDLDALDAPLGHDRAARPQLAAPPLADARRRSRASPPSRDVLHNLQERTELHGRAARAASSTPLHRPTSPAATCPRSRSPPSSSSPGGVGARRPARRATARCSAPTPPCSTGSRPTSASSTRRTPRAAPRCSLAARRELVDRPRRLARRGGRAQARCCEREHASPRATCRQRAPHLSRAVAPVWLASPYEVHRDQRHDALRHRDPLDAGADDDRRERRRDPPRPPGRRLRRPGDADARRRSRSRSSEPARTGASDRRRTPRCTARRLGARPARRAAADARAHALATAPGGEDLAELVNRRFYGGRIDVAAVGGHRFLGHGSLVARLRRGRHGHARRRLGRGRERRRRGRRASSSSCSSTRPTRPHESLMVITASAKHAVRVQQAVLDGDRHAPRPQRLRHRRPRRAVRRRCTIEQAVAQSRDRVIFSIGFGRTPHGRVLSDFGALGEPGRRAPARGRDDPRAPLDGDRHLLPRRATSTTTA